MPHYNFAEFQAACRDRKKVFVKKKALENADCCFNLKTEKKLLDFIHAGGLEDLRFFNTTDWKRNPNPECVIMIDAYEFRTANMLGYIAFFYNGKTSRWTIKSFKLSENRNTTMMIAFEKAGLCLPLKGESVDDKEE